MTALHIFDLDGTLMRRSACQEIARRVGKELEVDLVEDKWRAGQVGHAEFYEHVLPMLGSPSPDQLRECFVGADWLTGVAATFADITARGEHSLVITMSPQFYADHLLSMGVGAAIGSEVVLGEAVVASTVLVPESKPLIAQRVMLERGIPLSRCVAFGDGPSDMPLFELIPNTVSVNGSVHVDNVASRIYRGASIYEAYEVGRSVLDASRG